MVLRLLKSLLTCVFLCTPLIPAPVQAQDTESGHHFHLSAPAPMTMEFTFRAREPSGPPVADDFFGDGVAGSGTAGGCKGNGMSNAIRCGVTEKIKNRPSTPGSDAETRRQQAKDATDKGPTQSTLVLTLTPKVEERADGSFKVTMDASPKVTYSGAKPSADLKKQLEAEALTSLPGDIKGWSATFTQKDLENLHDAKATIHYDLHDQLKSMQMYNASSRLKLKLQNQKVFDPQIKAVVLIDDQFGQRLQPGQTPTRDYRYPFYANEAPSGAARDRYVLVLGKNLNPPNGLKVSSLTKNITYSVISNADPGLRALAQNLSGLPTYDGVEIIYLKADLAAGIVPGPATVSINGQTGTWGLGFVDRVGTLAFVRPDSHPGNLPEATFYVNETIRIGVIARDPGVPVDGIKAKLMALSVDKTTRPAGVTSREIDLFPLQAGDLNDKGRKIALSKPIQVIRPEDSVVGPQPASAPDIRKVVLQEGEWLAASIPDVLSFIPTPQVALAEIKGQPPVKSLWDEALEKVAACKGVGGDPESAGFVREPVTTISHTFFTEGFATRNITVSKGDLAAMGLLRNELIPHIQAANTDLLKFRGTGADGIAKARKYAGLARLDPNIRANPFWKYRKVKIFGRNAMGDMNIVEYPLYEMLDLAALTKKVNEKFNGRFSAAVRNGREITQADVREQAEKILQEQITTQYDQTQAAIGRAVDAGFCNVEELLVVAGQRSDIAVTNLLPKLMKQENGAWVPDTQARAYVRSVYIKGEAAKAQNDYAAADTSALSLTLGAAAAIVTAGASFYAAGAAAGGAATAVTGATYLSMAVDAADIGYFGRKGLQAYIDGERNYATTVGLSPVLNAGAVGEAGGSRQNAITTAIGLLMPGVSLSSSVKGLSSLKNIEAGRGLIRTRNFNSIDELSEVERLQIAAYYKSLQDQDASRFVRLFDKEQQDLGLMDRMLNDAKRAQALSETKDIMSTKFGLPGPEDTGGMPRGRPGGMASLDQDAPRGMPSGSDRGMLDSSILKSDAGTEVQDTRPFGMLPSARRAFQEEVDKAGLSVRVRAANDTSLAQMRQGHPPKHVKLKSKTINDLDVELGAKAGSQGMVGYFQPKKPADLVLPPRPEAPNAAQLAKWEEAVEAAKARHARLNKRYSQRLKEYGDNAKDIKKLRDQGLISVEDGVVIDRGLSNTRLNEKGELVYNRAGPEGGTVKGFTGDPDMWDIRHPDGRPIINDPSSPDFDEAAFLRKQQLQQALDNSLAKTQHGPHKDWRPVTQRDIGIDQKIRESHNPGGEALLEFTPGEKLPRTSYEIDDQGNLIPPKGPGDIDPDKTIKVGEELDPNKTIKVDDDVDPNKTVKVGDDPDLEKTIRVEDSGDPTVIIPSNQLDASATPATQASRLPEGQVDLFERPPGEWLKEQGTASETLAALIDKSRRGEALTTQEMLTKIDFLRQARAAAKQQ